jgi:predicted AAA+ superfamily ATPase
MIPRRIEILIQDRLGHVPAVALLGPRQAGKTTLAHAIVRGRKSVYLDLESPLDREKLSDATFYLSGHEDELVILDEVQRMPELFATLRGLIDQGRRRGKRSGPLPASWFGIARSAAAVGDARGPNRLYRTVAV